MPYSYYDTPDGEDAVKKIAFTTKYGVLVGLVCSTADVILITKPLGYLNILGRIYSISAPIIAGTVFGTAAVSVSTNYRKKDDEWNHFVGGAVGGITFGVFRNSVAAAAKALPITCLLATCVKHAYVNKFPLIELEKNRPRLHDAWSLNYNWSLVKDPKDS